MGGHLQSSSNWSWSDGMCLARPYLTLIVGYSSPTPATKNIYNHMNETAQETIATSEYAFVVSSVEDVLKNHPQEVCSSTVKQPENKHRGCYLFDLETTDRFSPSTLLTIIKEIEADERIRVVAIYTYPHTNDWKYLRLFVFGNHQSCPCPSSLKPKKTKRFSKKTYTVGDGWKVYELEAVGEGKILGFSTILEAVKNLESENNHPVRVIAPYCRHEDGWERVKLFINTHEQLPHEPQEVYQDTP